MAGSVVTKLAATCAAAVFSIAAQAKNMESLCAELEAALPEGTNCSVLYWDNSDMCTIAPNRSHEGSVLGADSQSIADSSYSYVLEKGKKYIDLNCTAP